MMAADTFEQAAQLAALAFERLARESLPPTPDNYTLWYTYYAGYLPDLNRAVDLMAKLGQPFTPARCDDLFKRFLRFDPEAQAVRERGDQAQKTIGGVVDELTDSGSTLNRSYDALVQLDRELSEPMPIGQVRAVVGEAAAQFQQAAATLKALRERLKEAARELTDVRAQMQTARLEALSDSLTGLANHQAFKEQLDAELAAAGRDALPLSLLIADIDHLKAFNQAHGELLGDHLLKLAAHLISRNIKGRDRAARFASDEFVIILPQTTQTDALVVAEQIRKAAAASEIANRSRSVSYGHFTLSLGVAGYRSGDSAATLVRRVLQALRQAKAGGRNRVCSEADS